MPMLIYTRCHTCRPVSLSSYDTVQYGMYFIFSTFLEMTVALVFKLCLERVSYRLMKRLCIKTQGQYETMEVVDQLNREIQTVTAGCHYGLNDLMIHFTNENKDKIMESVKASASSSMKISGVSSLDIFLNKTQWALCILLEDKTWKWLSVTTTVLMDLKTTNPRT